MKDYILKYRKNLILSVIFGILEVYFIYLFTIKSASLVDIFVGKDVGDPRDILVKALVFVLIACLSYYISEKNTNSFTQNICVNLRHDYIDALFLSRTASFYKKNKGDLLADIDQNVDQLRLDYLSTLPRALTGIGRTIVYIIGLYKIHPYILLATLAFVFLPGLVSSKFSKHISKLQVLRSDKYSKYIDMLNEVLEGYLVIKENNKKGYFLKKFDKDNQNLLAARNKLNITNSMLYEVLFALNLLSYLLIIYIGSLLVKNGHINISDLLASLTLVSISTNAMSEAFRDLSQILSTREIKDMVLVNLPDKIKDEGERKYPRLDIKIRDLSFSYGENVIFESLNLNIEKNKSYAIVGKSGSGKSTLAKILMKINDDYSGHISFENGDFRSFKEDEIYSLIYYLPQNTRVFRDSLVNNIAMDDRDIDLEKIEKIIEKVDLKYLYQKNKDTILSNDSLSGGEKKKLELARALYRQRKLVIFDEPTSGLDPKSAHTIEELIGKMDELTRLVITHNQDVAYLESFDKIVNIEDYHQVNY